MSEEQLLSVKQAAEFLGRSPRWVLRAIWYHILPAQKVGHGWRIRQDDLKGDLAAPGYQPKVREK